MRSNLMASIALAVVKLVIMPLIVYGLCRVGPQSALHDRRRHLRRCADRQDVYILAGEYKVEEPSSRPPSRSRRWCRSRR